MKYKLKHFMIWISQTLIAAAAPSLALCDDVPESRFALTSKENRSFLKYTCRKASPDTLSCNILLTTIKRNPQTKFAEDKEELEKLIPKSDDQRRQLIDWNITDKSQCAEHAAKAEQKLARHNPQPEEKEEALKIAKLGQEACINPTLENMLSYFRAAEFLNSRTCSVWVEHLDQNFKKIGEKWVHNSGPNNCGVISVAQFERTGKNSWNWEYTKNSIVTNNVCNLEETIVKFRSGSQRFFQKCDYLEYGTGQ